MASSAALDTLPGARLQGTGGGPGARGERGQAEGGRCPGGASAVGGQAGACRVEPCPSGPPPHPPWARWAEQAVAAPGCPGKGHPGHEAAAGGREGRAGRRGGAQGTGRAERADGRADWLPVRARADRQRAPRPAPVRITPRSRGAAPAGSAAQVPHVGTAWRAPRAVPGRRRVRVPRLPSPRPGFIFRHRVLSEKARSGRILFKAPEELGRQVVWYPGVAGRARRRRGRDRRGIKKSPDGEIA